MKLASYIFIFLVFISCSSTKITQSWKNNEYNNYEPKKILILGVTNNQTTRKIYEKKLTEQLENRDVIANESFLLFSNSFTNLKQTEENVQMQIEKLLNDGFDSVLISTVKGYDEKVTFNNDIFQSDYYLRCFDHYYYINQELYFNRDYYEKYKVYHIEISLYNLSNNTTKSLVWKGYYDIVNPQKVRSAIKDVVKAIIKSLEEEKLIPILNS